MKILVIQSSGMTFPRALRYLRDRDPPARIEVLLTQEAPLPDHPGLELDDTHRSEGSTFNPDGLPPSVCKRTFQWVVVLYPSLDSRGYENVERTAWAIPASEVLGVDYDLNTRTLTRWGSLLERTRAAFEQLAGLTIVGVVGLLYLLCLITKPFRSRRRPVGGETE